MSKGPTAMVLPPRQPAKGEASASVRSIEDRVPAAEAPALPATSPQGDDGRKALPPNVKALGGMVAVTVRMDRDTYERLKFHGVRTRQTNQDMLYNLIRSMLDAQDAS